MVVVNSRAFRANQKKYFELAKSNDVLITTRSHGNYRLVPVGDNDILTDEISLQSIIQRGIKEYEERKTSTIKDGESVEDFVNRLLSE